MTSTRTKENSRKPDVDVEVSTNEFSSHPTSIGLFAPSGSIAGLYDLILTKQLSRGLFFFVNISLQIFNKCLS